MSNRRIVRVRWLDHAELSGESTLDEKGSGPATYISTGFVTGETDYWLELSRDLQLDSDDEPTSKDGRLCILKSLVVSVTELN